jgi:transcriptional regulator with XRE-family HTH domain
MLATKNQLKIEDDKSTSDKELFLKALGKNVNRIRKEKGLSFQELANRCDIEKPNIVRLTTKGTNVTAATLLRIAKGLETTLADIFDFEH